MRKIIMAINATPDGFCDHRAVIADGELHHFFSSLLRDADTVLYGRKTFQMMYPYWPTVARDRTGTAEEIEFAEWLDAANKIVFSKKGIETSWRNTTVMNDLNPEEMRSLKSGQGKDILVGSPSIVDQLTAWGLIDEYYFLMQPFIGGSGSRFFKSMELDKKVRLTLAETHRLGSGAISLHYIKQD